MGSKNSFVFYCFWILVLIKGLNEVNTAITIESESGNQNLENKQKTNSEQTLIGTREDSLSPSGAVVETEQPNTKNGPRLSRSEKMREGRNYSSGQKPILELFSETNEAPLPQPETLKEKRKSGGGPKLYQLFQSDSRPIEVQS